MATVDHGRGKVRQTVYFYGVLIKIPMASFKAECGVIYELAYGRSVVGGRWTVDYHNEKYRSPLR